MAGGIGHNGTTAKSGETRRARSVTNWRVSVDPCDAQRPRLDGSTDADLAARRMKHRFNPTLETIQASSAPRRILFAHVGKCAGETIVEALGRFLPDKFSLFEMHCFDANVVTRAALDDAQNDLITVIAKRDPVERFVSAFNWDKHNLFFKDRLDGTRFGEAYRTFPSVDALISAMADPASPDRMLALRMARFGHMGMGQAWYTPLRLVAGLDPTRTFVCDTGTLKMDLGIVLRRLGHAEGWKEGRLPRAKSDYGGLYDHPNDLFSKTLSPENRMFLADYLSEDYAVYEALRRFYPDWHPAASTTKGAPVPTTPAVH